MKHFSFPKTTLGCMMVFMGLALASCDMMTEDRDDCPTGLYLQLKYDYNLQRADMFADHVGAVDVYVFDEQGKFVKMQSEENTASAKPLANPNYRMHLDLAPGKYQLIALAGQDSYAAQMARQRARFVRGEIKAGEDKTALDIRLDTKASENIGGDVSHVTIATYVDNQGQPLDTLWHGMEMEPIEVFAEKPTYHTVSLMRDTKKINVTLRELDNPSEMDIDNYDMYIYDRNAHLLWDNSVDEQEWTLYTPHATWNTEDLTLGVAESAPGRIGHADFMTSRIIYHGDAKEDARLVVVHKPSGREVIHVNVPDLLARLRNYEDTQRYEPQEFLDRGYDYQLSFFLKGGELQYVDISISILSWSVRVQMAQLD